MCVTERSLALIGRAQEASAAGSGVQNNIARGTDGECSQHVDHVLSRIELAEIVPEPFVNDYLVQQANNILRNAKPGDVLNGSKEAMPHVAHTAFTSFCLPFGLSKHHIYKRLRQEGRFIVP